MRKKKGRPKKLNSKSKSKNKKEYKSNWMHEGYKLHKADKFLGYCTCEHQTIISSRDLAKKTIYVCPQCNIRQKIKLLKRERNIVESVE